MGKLFVSLRTICSGNIEENEVDNQKIKWLDDFLDCIDDRLVIFYNFNVERDRIIKLLESKKIKYSEYSGRIKDFTDLPSGENSYQTGAIAPIEEQIDYEILSENKNLEYIDYLNLSEAVKVLGEFFDIIP